jgi:hypothetical protein
VRRERREEEGDEGCDVLITEYQYMCKGYSAGGLRLFFVLQDSQRLADDVIP